MSLNKEVTHLGGLAASLVILSTPSLVPSAIRRLSWASRCTARRNLDSRAGVLPSAGHTALRLHEVQMRAGPVPWRSSEWRPTRGEGRGWRGGGVGGPLHFWCHSRRLSHGSVQCMSVQCIKFIEVSTYGLWTFIFGCLYWGKWWSSKRFIWVLTPGNYECDLYLKNGSLLIYLS